jgi:hypothetical protein
LVCGREGSSTCAFSWGLGTRSGAPNPHGNTLVLELALQHKHYIPKGLALQHKHYIPKGRGTISLGRHESREEWRSAKWVFYLLFLKWNLNLASWVVVDCVAYYSLLLFLLFIGFFITPLVFSPLPPPK